MEVCGFEPHPVSNLEWNEGSGGMVYHPGLGKLKGCGRLFSESGQGVKALLDRGNVRQGW